MRMEIKDSDLIEVEAAAHTLYCGKIVTLRVDDIVQPDGKPAKREYVCHKGGASILAVDEENCMYLVRQFRYPYREILLEIPAGKLEDGEEAIVTARRELEEEVGLAADEVVPFGLIYPTPGYTNENLYVFLAKGLSPTKAHLDEGEFLKVVRMPIKDVLDKILSGEIRDGKTCYAVMKYCHLNNIH